MPNVRDLSRDADVLGALALWRLEGAGLTRTPSGLNNRSWFVDDRADRYVLRLYSSATREEVAGEHDFLRRLRSAGLPFATPTPVPSLDGSTCPLVPGTTTVAALFERIEGEHVDDDDLPGIEAAGRAFAQLDEVLATLHAGRPPWDGMVESVHPLVHDLSSLEELGDECADLVRRMAGAPSRLRATMTPRQVIHGDFAFSNVLVQGGRVVGVLDLEFVAEDARVAELATALRLVLSKGTRDLIWRPLLRGYLMSLPLSAAEINALPTLTAQHEAVVVAWWLGRYRSGKADQRSLDEHLVRALALEPWLAAHGSEVVAEARAIASAATPKEKGARST